MRIMLGILTGLVSVSNSTSAATILESGYGFQYNLFAATTGGGANQVNVDDGTVSTAVDSATGIDAAYSGANTAEVVGDLATGEIGAKSFDTDGNGPGKGASARIRLYETITFDLLDFDTSFTDDIEFAFGLDGTYVTDGSGLANGANVQATIQVNNVADPVFPNFASGLSLVALYASDGDSLDGDPIIGLSFSAGSPDDFSLSTGGSGTWTTLDSDYFVGDVTLFGGRINRMTISYELFVNGTADFLNTGTISLDSPYAYTSASGAFLSERVPAPVPLPAGMPLFLTGLGSILFILRQRKA